MGAALSKAGLERRTPLATATLVVAANAPDVDVFSYVQGEYFALAFRRGITHGLPAQLLLPFAVAGGMMAWDRWFRRRRRPDAPPAKPGAILLLSFLGVLTHPALDWMNVYGMRWGLPFSDAWSYGDALFIIDPWLWLLLGGAVVLSGAGRRALWIVLALVTTALMVVGPVPLAARVGWLVGVAVVAGLAAAGRPRSPGARARLAFAACVTALAYVGAMTAADSLARRQVASVADARGVQVVDVMVSPSAANPFGADVEVRTPEGYIPGRHTWLPTPAVTLRPEDRVPLRRIPPELTQAHAEEILARAEAEPDVRHYLTWSRFPYVSITKGNDGWVVRYSDARYDDRAGAGGLGGVEVVVPAEPDAGSD